MVLVEENPLANAGDIRDAGSIPGSGISPGEENSNPLQCSCLGNPMDRGAWQAIVYGVTKSRTWLSDWAQLLSYLEKGYLPACLNRGRTQESLDCYAANNNSGLAFLSFGVSVPHFLWDLQHCQFMFSLTIELLRPFFISVRLSFTCRISSFSDPFIVPFPISLFLFHTFLVFFFSWMLFS